MSDQMVRDMLVLKALDPGADLKLSEYTGKWYVSTCLEIGNGVILSGVAEHEATPERAVAATLARLQSVTAGCYVASKYAGKRREYRWNGGAFAECTREEAMR